MNINMFVGVGISSYALGPSLIDGIRYTPVGAGNLRRQLDRLVLAVECLEEGDYLGQLSRLTNSPGPVFTAAGTSNLQPAMPDDWYRTDASWSESSEDDGPANPWSLAVPPADSLASLSIGHSEPGDVGRLGVLGPEGITQFPVYSGRLSRALEGTREGLLRFIGGIITALSLVLVLVLAALSRRFNTVNLVLLLIAACRRFGHRDEPGDDNSLLARRYQSLPGRAPAV